MLFDDLAVDPLPDRDLMVLHVAPLRVRVIELLSLFQPHLYNKWTYRLYRSIVGIYLHTPCTSVQSPMNDPYRHGMIQPRTRTAVLVMITALSACAAPAGNTTDHSRGAPAPAQTSTDYISGTATTDGIGKYFMGREISQVMGHLGAGWLERDTRAAEERTDLLLDYLFSQDGQVVADIGVGTGYFALPWAHRLSGGRVLGVDIQPEMLDILAERATSDGLINVEPVLGAVDDPNLPSNAVDIVLIVDAYHEFSHPREMAEGIVRGLRPGGRLVLVEYRGEDPFVPIKELHKMTEKQTIRELSAAGLRWVGTESFLPQQHVLVFEKPGVDTGSQDARRDHGTH
jgi:SAM-dependent methyltransferase